MEYNGVWEGCGRITTSTDIVCHQHLWKSRPFQNHLCLKSPISTCFQWVIQGDKGNQSMAVIRTLDKYFDWGSVVGYHKALIRCKDPDAGVCLPVMIPNTFLAEAELEQSLEEATPMINQGNKSLTFPLLRFRDSSLVQPGHFPFGGYWHIP